MSTSQGAVAVLGDWEGNRRSGVALAMHHRLTVYPLTGSIEKGREMSTHLHSCKEFDTLYFLPLSTL